ncbi:MAG: glutamine synthetase beta-grasp domain-containing protein [Cyanobacteria bacterium P01_H01_bin.74]
MLSQVEYIWLDGAEPTRGLRSKMRLLNFSDKTPTLNDIPVWSFDGSSTNQADGSNSDLLLKPVTMVNNPLQDAGNYLVMCEVLNEDSTPHRTNTRAVLAELLSSGASKQEPWIGFEQEYTLFKNGRPLGWPETGYPAPQGPYYCAVGSSKVDGRELVEAHTEACLEAGIMLYGVNAEVMLGQWEFQIGYRGLSTESADPLNVADHLWLSRWLLYRLGEEFDTAISLDNKPVKGDWNGAGQHTNFSTKAMRDPADGIKSIEKAVEQLSQAHEAHIAVYGVGNEYRLTGLHETCDIKQFRHGVADRGCSVRIPRSVAIAGYGYLEDRRPGANADPYEIASALVKTICLSEHSTKQNGKMPEKVTA